MASQAAKLIAERVNSGPEKPDVIPIFWGVDID